MFVRYHMIYYAVAILGFVLGKYFHWIFYVGWLVYLIWMMKRWDYRYVIIALCLCACFLFPRPHQELSTHIQGKVVACYDKYCYVETKQGKVKLFHDEDLHYGDRIIADIELLDMNRASNDEAFDEMLYLQGQNIFYKARMIQLIDRQSTLSLYQIIESRLSANEDINAYQRLFVLGEKTESIQEDYQLLASFSLVHLFALSGMHIHILSTMLQGLFGLFLWQKQSRWLSIICIGLYVFSIPMQISLYRAFFCLLLMELLQRWFHQLDVLSLLFIISLIYNPYYIYNISFIFSYFIYLIVLLTKHLPYSSLLIYLSSLPLILHLNYQISFLSLFLTYCLTPFIEYFYIFTLLSILFPFLTGILGMMITMFQMIYRFINSIHLQFMLSKVNLSFIVIFYILFFRIIYCLELKQSIQRYISMMLALMIAFSFYSQYKIYGEITMINVGQGDCTLVRLPMNQGNILIDTGGQKDYDLATTTIIPYLQAIGIHSLDYVYISHDDYDHCGALDSLIENFEVKHVIRDYEEYRHIGPLEIHMLKGDTFYSDSNDQSLVMSMKLYETTLLMTGDISSEVEKELCQKYEDLHADILKVSHHGSQSATSSLFLKKVNPSIAMIGVGKNNLYKHPSSLVIERLKRKGIVILRTDLDGMFHIRIYGKSRYILS